MVGFVIKHRHIYRDCFGLSGKRQNCVSAKIDEFVCSLLFTALLKLQLRSTNVGAESGSEKNDFLLLFSN